MRAEFRALEERIIKLSNAHPEKALSLALIGLKTQCRGLTIEQAEQRIKEVMGEE